MMLRAIVCTAITEMIASIGERSSGPIIGRIRRKACSSGHTGSLPNCRFAYCTPLSGRVTKLGMMYPPTSRMYGGAKYSTKSASSTRWGSLMQPSLSQLGGAAQRREHAVDDAAADGRPLHLGEAGRRRAAGGRHHPPQLG